MTASVFFSSNSSAMPWGKRKAVLLTAAILIAVFVIVLLSYPSPGRYLALHSNCVTVGDVSTSSPNIFTTEVRSSGLTPMYPDLASKIDHLRLVLDKHRFMNGTMALPQSYSQLKSNLNLMERDLGVLEFRSDLSKRLSLEIQLRIHKLQNPTDCKNAPKLYCNLTNPAGLASGVHDLLWCFVKAYFSQRMLVLMSKNWHYTPTNWESYFLPLTQKCTKEYREEHKTEMPGPQGETRNLLAKLPLDLADQMLQLGTRPIAWWYGQFLGFALRPNVEMQALIRETEEQLDFKHPVVGLHIRRSDKVGSEAQFHPLAKYMKEVEAYFAVLEESGQKLDKKRVFLASDDPKVYQECLQRYPGYHFMKLANVSSLAANLTTRYNADSIKATLLEIYLLSRTDYIVCTFSSGFCRLAFELMQYHRPNSLTSAFSLDVIYHYAVISNPDQKALYDRRPTSKDELQLQVGDLIRQPLFWSLAKESMQGKSRYGMTIGVNLRTKQEGYYWLADVQPQYEYGNAMVF